EGRPGDECVLAQLRPGQCPTLVPRLRSYERSMLCQELKSKTIASRVIRVTSFCFARALLQCRRQHRLPGPNGKPVKSGCGKRWGPAHVDPSGLCALAAFACPGLDQLP